MESFFKFVFLCWAAAVSKTKRWKMQIAPTQIVVDSTYCDLSRTNDM